MQRSSRSYGCPLHQEDARPARHGTRAATLGDLPPTDDDWHLNLLWIDRQKCALLVHQGTLFSVFRARVRSADLRPLGNYLVTAIETELRAEGLPRDTFSTHADCPIPRVQRVEVVLR